MTRQNTVAVSAPAILSRKAGGRAGLHVMRQNTPCSARTTIVFTPGEWVRRSTTALEPNDHYNGTQYQPQRKAIGNFVDNKQQLFDIAAS